MRNPLKELREKHKLSGLKMAVILGLNANYYYGIENGSYGISEGLLNKLREKFNIEPKTLKKEFQEWKLEREKELLRGE